MIDLIDTNILTAIKEDYKAAQKRMDELVNGEEGLTVLTEQALATKTLANHHDEAEYQCLGEEKGLMVAWEVCLIEEKDLLDIKIATCDYPKSMDWSIDQGHFGQKTCNMREGEKPGDCQAISALQRADAKAKKHIENRHAEYEENMRHAEWLHKTTMIRR